MLLSNALIVRMEFIDALRVKNLIWRKISSSVLFASVVSIITKDA